MLRLTRLKYSFFAFFACGFLLLSFLIRQRPQTPNVMFSLSNLGGGGYDLGNTQAKIAGMRFISPALPVPSDELLASNQSVLGVATDRYLEVSISKKQIVAWQNDNKQLVLPILIDNNRLPPIGNYKILAKQRYSQWQSKNLFSAVNLPNVPYVQYLAADLAIHGSYWRDKNDQATTTPGNIGLSITDAEKLFYWTFPLLVGGENTILSANDQATLVKVIN